ncbi:MAG: SDR family oxidoreductase [Actinomycetota bacterium]|nr:SDR family oxidoreductase [Actinomycetota bacterium]
MSEEHFVNVLNANLVSAYRLAKLAIRPMMKARHGRIILISSAGALAGVPGQTNYAAAKSGLVGFGRSLAKEVASRGITVNIIAPGWTDTDMVSHLTDDQRTAAISEVPLGRFAHPTEIADAALYLADAAYVTGVVLPIDGGAAMGI